LIIFHSFFFSSLVQYQFTDGVEDGGDAAQGEEAQSSEELVSIKFARHQTDKARLAEQRSFKHLEKVSESEPWTRLQFLPRSSDQAALVRSELMASNLDSVIEAMEVEDVKGSFDRGLTLTSGVGVNTFKE
jgi:hypothetical protein